MIQILKKYYSTIYSYMWLRLFNCWKANQVDTEGTRNRIYKETDKITIKLGFCHSVFLKIFRKKRFMINLMIHIFV